jgi:hypothetical protein
LNGLPDFSAFALFTAMSLALHISVYLQIAVFSAALRSGWGLNAGNGLA